MSAAEVRVSKILPPRENEGEPQTTSLRIPAALLAKLDAVARERGYSRTEVMLHFLRWSLQEHEAEKGGTATKR